ncbi:putative protein phosphatase 2C 49, partial [Tetrabaena socialis]
MRAALHALDEELTALGHNSGTTVNAVMLLDNTVTVVNTGDCRCILFDWLEEKAVQVTTDHNLACKLERERVLGAGAELSGCGGYVVLPCPDDGAKLLGVTKALGHAGVKALQRSSTAASLLKIQEQEGGEEAEGPPAAAAAGRGGRAARAGGGGGGGGGRGSSPSSSFSSGRSSGSESGCGGLACGGGGGWGGRAAAEPAGSSFWGRAASAEYTPGQLAGARGGLDGCCGGFGCAACCGGGPAPAASSISASAFASASAAVTALSSDNLPLVGTDASGAASALAAAGRRGADATTCMAPDAADAAATEAAAAAADFAADPALPPLLPAGSSGALPGGLPGGGGGGASFMLTCEPDVFEFTVEDDRHLLLIGCDGVFDSMTNVDACRTAMRQLSSSNSCLDAAREVAHRACRLGSGDNITALVLRFGRKPVVRRQSHSVLSLRRCDSTASAAAELAGA